jgi:metal-responsive CopG/Arc/MetJ family transcriptional regulator
MNAVCEHVHHHGFKSRNDLINHIIGEFIAFEQRQKERKRKENKRAAESSGV